MKITLGIAALAALVSGSAMLSGPVRAQDYNRRYDDSRHYDRYHHAYRGRGGDYRHRCGSGNGAVGTIAGGVGGALIGNGVGGGTLGTVAGGVGGALLGRTLDKSHTRSRNGC